MEISNYVGDSIEYSDFYQYKRGKKGAITKVIRLVFQ